MFCKKCGRELKEGEKFCARCGEKVVIQAAEDSAKKQREAEEAEKIARRQREADEADEIARRQRETDEADEIARKKKEKEEKIKKILVYAGALVAVLAVGISIGWAINHKSKAPVEVATPVDPSDDTQAPVADDIQAPAVDDTQVPTVDDSQGDTQLDPPLPPEEPKWERPNNYSFDDAFVRDFNLSDQHFEKEYFEPWDKNIDDEVYGVIFPEIRERDKNLGSYKMSKLAGGKVVAYTAGGTPVKVIALSGFNGWNVNRTYYGVSDFYAELSTNDDYVELYYSEGRLCRVMDSWGYYYDYNCEGWEELNDLGVITSRDRAEVYEFVKNNVW